jgi:hypothetical protein
MKGLIFEMKASISWMKGAILTDGRVIPGMKGVILRMKGLIFGMRGLILRMKGSIPDEGSPRSPATESAGRKRSAARSDRGSLVP